MKNTGWTLVGAALLTLVVGVTSNEGWPGWVLGAIVALVLWVLLFAGSYAGPPERRGTVAATNYALAAGITVLVGVPVTLIMDEMIWWSVAAILGGVAVNATGPGTRPSTRSGR